MKKLILFSAFTLMAMSLYAQYDITGKVIKVLEGDKVEILTAEDDTVLVCLSDVDSPDEGQEFHAKAKEFTEEICLKKKVNVQLKGRDREGRNLGIIYLSKGTNVNNALVESGYAWYYSKANTNESLASLEKVAKDNKKGLWEQSEPTPPWIYRRKMSMMAPKSSL